MPKDPQDLNEGVVYTETVVFSPPAQYAADAPYQLAIVELTSGERLTARVVADELGDRARIGDHVVLAEQKDGVAYYKKASSRPVQEIG